MSNYFPFVEQVAYGGRQTDQALAYRFYDPSKMVLGKTMAEHLRISVCMWHTFCWQGADGFGANTFPRSWNQNGDSVGIARARVDAAIEFAQKLQAPFLSFHDEDLLPLEGRDIRAYFSNLDRVVDYIGQKMQDSGVGLLLGTSNLFSNPCFAAGAATNPDPAVFAFASAKVRNMMEKTKALNGQNYVLWGGRDGYNSLLNTDLGRELDQLGRFVSLAVEHKHRIGFKGALLIEPKPCEPSKHQYDYDVATVYGFLKRYGLENEVQVNIEANHATLAGHSFEHEVAYACTLGILGSIDANRGDEQNGWDTDQFPGDIGELSRVLYRLLDHGGFSKGGFNFDAKIRRDSVDAEDLFHGHIGGIDAIARSLELAAEMVRDNFFTGILGERYADWSSPEAQAMLRGERNLEQIADTVLQQNQVPLPRSAGQERSENRFNRYLWS